MTFDPSEAAIAAVDALSNAVITIERRSGTYSGGRWRPAAPVRVQGVNAQVTPIMNALERLAEGNRVGASIRVISTTELRMADHRASHDADVIVYAGARYEVSTVDVWPGYWDATAVRIEEG